MEGILWFFIECYQFLIMKLKSKPTIRGKHKYVVFKIHSTSKLQYNDVKNAIMNSLLNWMGEKDFADAGAHKVIIACKDSKVLDEVKKIIDELDEGMRNRTKAILLSELLRAGKEIIDE